MLDEGMLSSCKGVSHIPIYDVNPTKQRQQIAAMNYKFTFIKSNQPKGLMLDRS